MKYLLTMVVSLSLLATAAHALTPGEVVVGEVLRDARMYAIGGQMKQLSAFRGKPLIINVWASWCGPCRAEMGSLDRLSKLDRKKQFQVIGISTDDDAFAASEFVLRSRRHCVARQSRHGARGLERSQHRPPSRSPSTCGPQTPARAGQ